jgi:hypothetical protein
LFWPFLHPVWPVPGEAKGEGEEEPPEAALNRQGIPEPATAIAADIMEAIPEAVIPTAVVIITVGVIITAGEGTIILDIIGDPALITIGAGPLIIPLIIIHRQLTTILRCLLILRRPIIHLREKPPKPLPRGPRCIFIPVKGRARSNRPKTTMNAWPGLQIKPGWM